MRVDSSPAEVGHSSKCGEAGEVKRGGRIDVVFLWRKVTRMRVGGCEEVSKIDSVVISDHQCASVACLTDSLKDSTW